MSCFDKCDSVLDICQEYMVSLPDCKNIIRGRDKESLVHAGINFRDLHMLAAALDYDKLSLIGSGNSMKPFLSGQEKLYVEKREDFREEDIVLFIRHRRLIAHRVRSVNKDGRLLITQGDNCVESESVSFDNVIGVVISHAVKPKHTSLMKLKNNAERPFREKGGSGLIKIMARLY